MVSLLFIFLCSILIGMGVTILIVILNNLITTFKCKKEYPIITTSIELDAKQLMINLKLPIITIYFNRTFKASFYFTSTRYYLSFGMPLLLGIIDNTILLDSLVSTDNSANKIYSVIAHEIAHYLQFYRHKKWFYKYTEIERKYKIGYKNSKIEKNANKIAKILCKRYGRTI